MNLELSEQQKQLRETFRTFARDTVRPASSGVDAGGEFPAGLLATVGQHGWLGEDEGDLVAACLLLEELARENVSLALAVAVQKLTVVQALSQWGSADSDLVPQLLSDLRSGTVAGAAVLPSTASGVRSESLSVEYSKTDGGYQLDGTVDEVANAAQAQILLIAAREAGGEEAALFAVMRDSQGVTVEAGSRSLGATAAARGTVGLSGAQVATSGRLNGVNEIEDWLERWASFGRLAVAAISVGVGRAAFEGSLEVLTNQPSGPEATGQSLQFYFADMSTEVDAARLMTWKAAWALGNRRRVGIEASQAKLFATETAQKATDLALQIAGPDGYDRGSDFDRQFRDARSLELFHGARETHKRVIADRVVDER